MKRILFFIAFIVVVYSGTVLSSCKKTGDTVASVMVIDSLGAGVPSATVTLWQDTARNPVTGAQGTIRVSGLTDGSGNARFTFANEALLNIDAVRTAGDPDSAHVGHGYIKLVKEQTVYTTVRIPY